MSGISLHRLPLPMSEAFCLVGIILCILFLISYRYSVCCKLFVKSLQVYFSKPVYFQPIRITFFYPMETQNISLILSYYSILIRQKALSISQLNKIVLNLDLTKISHTEFWRAGPVSRQSFRKAQFFAGFEEASYTILSCFG